MGTLTAAGVKSVSKPGRYGDGGTLYLNIAKGGTKSWVQRITIDGRRHDIGLGGWPVVSLASARRRAIENRTAVADGRNPLQEKRRAKVPTFRQAATHTLEALKPRWRNRKHSVSWMQTLERHAMPRLANMPVDRIQREDVLAVLTPIWGTIPETARRVRQRIRATLLWCLAHGYVEQNVAGEGIDGALPRMPAIKSHFRALPYREISAALKTVEASKASMAAKLCLRFLVLTATRSSEARGAKWDEVDFEAREWCILGGRMKAGSAHRVPLSDPAIAVLKRAQKLDDGSGLIFPSPVYKGKAMSDMTLMKVLRSTGLADRTTVHGFRSSFRDWAAERTNAPHAVMELALAHAVGNSVEQAYARSDLLAKRRLLMDQWAAFITRGKASKVVQFYG